MSVDELLIYIENLDNEEIDRFLMLIKEKYNLTNKLPQDVFAAGENYNFGIIKRMIFILTFMITRKESSTNSKQNNLYS